MHPGRLRERSDGTGVKRLAVARAGAMLPIVVAALNRYVRRSRHGYTDFLHPARVDTQRSSYGS